MPGKSSDDGETAGPLPSAPAVGLAAAATCLGWPGRGLLLALNFIPSLHLLGLVAVAWRGPDAWSVRAGLAAAWLWLMPPLVTRFLLALSPLVSGTLPVGSRKFFVWWTTIQLQAVFLRLPWLEEIMRLIPGVYSLWLRLWGAQIGQLTFWAHGVELTDRSLVDVGDDVILGAKVRLCSHALRRTPGGDLELLVGRVKLGHRAFVGAQSVLGPGTELANDEATKAFFLAPPFSRWQGNRRERPASTL